MLRLKMNISGEFCKFEYHCSQFDIKIIEVMKQFRYTIMWMMALWISAQAQAQSSALIVQRDANGLFLYHVVAPKENFYSIGRLFNISPKVIAPFNGLQLAGGLSIGQKIKIPLQEQNFTTAKTKAAGVVLVPVYRDEAGKKIVAGFLKVVKGQSPLASGGPAVSVPATTAASGVEPAAGPAQPGNTAQQAATTAASGGAASNGTPAVTAPVDQPGTAIPPSSGETAAVAATPPPVKPKPIKRAPIAKPAPVAAQVVTQDPPPAPAPVAPAATTATTARYAGEGVFHPDYLSQTDNGRKTRGGGGLAGTFKSTSGWDNGKFYALMNNVERGTVVKVTNLGNNKVVFVKVLGDIADIRENAGMVIVLSDAAAAQLGISNDRFTSELSYAK